MNSPGEAANVPRRIAVIGAGLTGLAAAHRLLSLDPTAQIVLYEATDRIGGHIQTVERDGFLIERGADAFITNKPAAVELCRELGIEDRLIPTNEQFRGSLVLRNGRPVPVPDGFSLLTPTRLVPILRSPIFTWKGKLRIAAEQFVRRSRSSEEESVSAFVRRRFGDEAFERLVQPMLGGIYTADPDKLSLAATMPRFIDMERDHGSLIKATRRQAADTGTDKHASGARYGLFATFEDGMQQFFAALRTQVESGATIITNTAVETVSQTNNGWDIKAASESLFFDAVIITTPTFVAADLLAESSPRLADRLREIQYASAAVVATGHRRQDVSHPCDAFGLVIPAIENRRILAVSFSSRKFPGRAPQDHILMRTFVGGATQPEQMDRSDEELVELVREELSDLLGVTGRETISLVTRYTKAMPQYHLGHRKLVQSIEQLTATLPGLELAGSAYHGVGIPDSIQSGRLAGENLASTK